MLYLNDSQIPAVHDFGLFMALIVSCCWLWVSILMPAALCIWTQWVEPHEHAWMNWWGAIFWEILFVNALRHLWWVVIPSAVSLPKLSPPSEAGSCFQACQRATVLCQTRMMMWRYCQWTRSQVRLLSLQQRVNDRGRIGKGMSSGRTTLLFSSS